ncbi:PREDICTED: zinc finger HIT domain-containing protein 2 [Rhagoletis zephyria]|uniref:zinc finger HIT domain-containing protein 2 n=1 Tax=Rhagoletis zephyria TaxID=28612 RepID=UPI0008115ECD|nr:PREDICTED: zinc finger HIT domain-containing protein 2 [Rhagoletis zephyria]
MASTYCQFCEKDKFKYTCPKCNALYCSVACYKAPEHLKCSEEFYKSCIQEDLTTSQPNSRDDMKKMYEILTRMHESEAGLEPDFNDPIDSDDEGVDAENCAEVDLDEDDEEDVEDIATRLQDVDINDADEIWHRLTSEERSEFKKMVDCGEIMKLLPSYKPWWMKSKAPKIVEVSCDKSDQADNSNVPEIEKQIPKFSSICKKPPSSCLHYNLWNILTSYGCMVRYFNGEHSTSPTEAVSHLVNLCLNLKFGTNFEDVDDAIVSVEMEALTTKNIGVSANNEFTSLTTSRDQLESDARSLMSSCYYKLAALSDICRLMVCAKNYLKRNKSTPNSDFHKLFAICNGSVELDRKKLIHLIKKIEFLLSYVNRENDERLE